jgi:hypothetical protein
VVYEEYAGTHQKSAGTTDKFRYGRPLFLWGNGTAWKAKELSGICEVKHHFTAKVF